MNPQALVSPTQQPLTAKDLAMVAGRAFPSTYMAGLLSRAMAYNPDQPRDAHGRFGETQDDQSDALINSPEVLKDLRVPAVMYHVTTEVAAQAILRDGLKPGQPRASTLGASRGVYLTDDPSNISKGAGDVGGTVVLQVSTKGLSLRLDPEFFYYDHSASNAKAYVQAVNEGQESFALYSQKTIPASHITRLKTLAYNDSQPRDEHGRWAGGPADFSQAAYDISPDLEKSKVFDAKDVKSVKAQLRAKGRLNADGTVSLYHITLTDDANSTIMQQGLIPAKVPAPAQDWEADHSAYATYFFQDRAHAEDQLQQAGAGHLIEARMPITPATLSRLVPDEDTGLPVHQGVQALLEGGAVAVIGGVPKQHLTLLRSLAYNPDQPRDDHGRWGDGGTFSVEENTALDKAIGVEVQKVSAPLGYIADSAIWAKAPARAAMKQKVEAEVAARLQTNDTLTTGPHVLAKTVVDDWAITSGDHSGFSVRGQQAVAEEFGLSDAATDHLGPSSQMEHPDITSHDLKAYARAEYENTQQWFKDRGITHVSVYRGMQRVKMVEGEQTVTMQPASSWTTDRKTASIFAGGRFGETPPIMEARVPISRVLSTAVTGRGALIEAEVVLLGGSMKVRVRR